MVERSKDLLHLEVTLDEMAEIYSGPDKSIYSKRYANSVHQSDPLVLTGARMLPATCSF